MTRQARPSAKINGFDTHMILEAVPARHSEHQNGHQAINQDITPLCRGPGTAICGLGRGELSLWMAKSAIPFASAPARRLDSR